MFYDIYAPQAWRPHGERYAQSPRVGHLFGFRYSAWRVRSVADRDDMWVVELEHVRGPIQHAHAKIRTLALGEKVIHVGIKKQGLYQTMPEPFMVCSCHGDPWPCKEMHDARNAERATKGWMNLYDRSAPNVCNACGEAITDRQKTVKFPEPWLELPDGGLPEYHVRQRCWSAAHDYELKLRLPAYPGAERLASCAGVLFIHTGFTECTAESLCTGLHGPPRERTSDGIWCGTLYRDSSDISYEASLKCPGPKCRGTLTKPPFALMQDQAS